MKNKAMTSMERVLTTLSHQEPDKVPLFLLTTMHGAKELGMTIKEYFSKAENVVEGQIRLHKKYGSDCCYPFFYAPLESEAFGGEVIYREDGPPNSGMPILKAPKDIENLVPPKVSESRILAKALTAIKETKKYFGDTVPIIGIVVSPFSLPVMQMGFDNYLNIMFENKRLFEKLIEINIEFCIEWGNAQLEAGATAIGYFDPVSSSNIISRETYLETGYLIEKKTLANINGPTAIHFASGRSLDILDDVSGTGAALVGVGFEENLSELKAKASGKISLLGNLNGIEMRKWNERKTEEMVKNAIAAAGKGGGYILSDSHGEIPWQVSDETLFAIRKSVDKWGNYPLSWIDDYEK